MIGQRRQKQTLADQQGAYATVTLRDEGVCVKCRRVHPIHGVNRDHRQRRDPYNTTPSNLQLLCGSGTTGCHGWKTQNPMAALAEGYTVPSGVDPAGWPARRWFMTGRGTFEQGWCLYDNDGQVRRISDDEARARMEGAHVE